MEQQIQTPNGARSIRGKGTVGHIMALVKEQIIDAMERVFAKDIKVRGKNDKVFLSYFNLVGKKIDSLSSDLQKLSKIVSSFSSESRTSKEEFLYEDKQLQNEIKTIQSTLAEFPQIIHGLEDILEQIVKKNMVVNVPEFPKIEFPKLQKVEGTIKVLNQPDISELKTISKKIEEVRSSIQNIKFPTFPKIEIPKTVIPKFPTKISFQDKDDIINALADLKASIENIKFPEVEFPTEINVGNFPPIKYPIPPTSMSIRPLRGEVKSRTITVTTSITPLPDEVLSYRRSLVVYNNSSSVIYIGGSDVTATNGMPVPASSYSPPIDAGPKMIVYGIVATGTANVRVLEVSDQEYGRSQ